MKKKNIKEKKDALLGREPAFSGLIGHRRNHYATDTDSN